MNGRENQRKRWHEANNRDVMEFGSGKIPPQDIAIEKATLGAILLESHCLSSVIPVLKKETFYKEEHQHIYDAIVNMYRNQKVIDILTVVNYLRNVGALEAVGGPYYITKLTDSVASSLHIEEHAEILNSLYLKREMIRISGEVYKEAFSDEKPTDELLQYSQNEFYKLTLINSKQDVLHISAALDELPQNTEEIKGISGVPSGYKTLDAITSGWQPSDLIIIAARPGMGKTSFAINTAVKMAKAKIPVGVFSLEMSRKQLMMKIIAGECKINSNKIRDNNLTNTERTKINEVKNVLKKIPFYIDDTSALSVLEFKAKVRRLVEQCAIKLIVVDYLQLMTTGDKKEFRNRESEISYISSNLKAIAKDMNIPIICLSQLSRETEKRKIQRPLLSDLRESGSIEQDADIVIFLYRPEYYGDVVDKKGFDLRGKAEIIFAKFRNGATTTTYMNFIKEFTLFEENESTENAPQGTVETTIEEEF